MAKFKNRHEAGDKLADKLQASAANYDLVLALPRGGVPVGKQISSALSIPLDVFVVRKLGAPNNPEYGIGAVAEPNLILIDDKAVELLQITNTELQDVISKEEEEMKRRIELYRNNKHLPNLSNRDILLVDDGVATGITAKAAIVSIKDQNPNSLTFASPVCSKSSYDEILNLVDDMVCLVVSKKLRSVGQFYKNFEQVTDNEVVRCLNLSINSVRWYK